MYGITKIITLLKITSHTKFKWPYVSLLDAVFTFHVSSITYRNRSDFPAPQQRIPAAVAPAERDMPGTRLKGVLS